MDDTSKCAICGSADRGPSLVYEGYHIAECPQCGVWYVVNRPAAERLFELYDTGELFGGVDDSTPLPEEAYRTPAWKQKEHQRILDWLAELGATSGKLLDVGCLWGIFLAHASARGFDVQGVEPHRRAVEHVREHLGFPVFHGLLREAQFPDNHFDVVTMLDVIEHVHDPVAEIAEIRRILKPGGVLVVGTPNVVGLLPQMVRWKRKVFHQPWAPMGDVPWHLWGFTPRSLAACLRAGGLEVESVRFLHSRLRSTNRRAGRHFWKRWGMKALALVGDMIGQGDRMVALARKRN